MTTRRAAVKLGLLGNVNERTLCRIWNRQSFDRGDLRGSDGRPIQVVYRGRWQHGPGPDFRGAIIAGPNAGLLHGDVEVHVRSSDWLSHRHHHDPAYNAVILHIVLQDDGQGPTIRQDGQEVPSLALATYLPPLDDSLLEEGDDGGPADAPCRSALDPADGGRVGVLLDRMGGERLWARAAYYEGELTSFDPDEVVYRGLLDAMGYSQNRAPFRELAARLPLAELSILARAVPAGERADFFARALLAKAGLTPEPPGPTVDGTYLAPMRREQWRIAGIRPANQPERRIRGVAHLLAAHADGGLARRLCLDWPEAPPRRACAELRRRLVVRDPTGGGRAGNLVGPGRAADVVVNVLLPFTLAYADLHSRPALREAVLAAYGQHRRLADNEITRAMATTLLGSEWRRAAPRTARRQQGLLQLFKRYCDYRRCAECPAASLR
ncbi:MAG: DUF2851 family protein [Chloroflexota bacterium]